MDELMEKEESIDNIDLEDDIEKRRPKPFRYVSSLDEKTTEQDSETDEVSVMTDELVQSQKLQRSFESAVGIGNVDAIETVLRKHELKRGKR
ncbi:MAG: hypothetical protein JW771_08355 [Candidatus Thermoplasmatota archaeon]|nr:hypothetical protein [Candidatus Thermoplasmatota archaeon]